MSIPETQLQTWSNIGATDLPQRTHLSIRTALDSFKNWQSNDVKFDPYLSGSYANSTNIYGNSDVDLVVELISVEYSNLTENEKTILQIEPASYNWLSFRQDVISALTNYYGASYVDTTGKKSIKVLPTNGRLKADVIVSSRYTYYENLKIREQGIVFWTNPEREKIINYPKAHLTNGVKKDADDRTRGWYKRTIRTYKNARDKIYANKPQLKDNFPSYFIECLLYNVEDNRFGGSYQSNFVDILNWLNYELYSDRAEKMVCQNGMYYLFQNTSVTWNINSAKQFVGELIELWNNW